MSDEMVMIAVPADILGDACAVVVPVEYVVLLDEFTLSSESMLLIDAIEGLDASLTSNVNVASETMASAVDELEGVDTELLVVVDNPVVLIADATVLTVLFEYAVQSDQPGLAPMLSSAISTLPRKF